MKKWMLAAALAMVALSTSGCGVLRSIEQWKCDRFGCCPRGMRPSHEVQQQCQPIPDCPGVVTNACGPILTSP